MRYTVRVGDSCMDGGRGRMMCLGSPPPLPPHCVSSDCLVALVRLGRDDPSLLLAQLSSFGEIGFGTQLHAIEEDVNRFAIAFDYVQTARYPVS